MTSTQISQTRYAILSDTDDEIGVFDTRTEASEWADYEGLPLGRFSIEPVDCWWDTFSASRHVLALGRTGVVALLAARRIGFMLERREGRTYACAGRVAHLELIDGRWVHLG
jgi:hypothetical protein